MKYGLISLLPLQIVRLLKLVRSIEAVRLEGDSQAPWVLLVSGRGFNRLLRDEPLMSPYLHRTVDPTTARPMRFLTHKSAVRYAQSVGLMAQQTTWSLRER